MSCSFKIRFTTCKVNNADNTLTISETTNRLTTNHLKFKGNARLTSQGENNVQEAGHNTL